MQVTASRYRSVGKRAREQRIHRESRHAVKECRHGDVRGHYGEAALKYAAQHLPTAVLEYTECERQLRSAALHVAKSRRLRGS
jgi:hypothetical protein